MKSSRTILNCGIGLEFECDQNWDSMSSVSENDKELFEGSLFKKKCSHCNKIVHLVSSIKSLGNGAELGYCMMFDPYFESKEIEHLRIRIKEIELEKIDFKDRTLGVFRKL
jgi:hypothetical protein